MLEPARWELLSAIGHVFAAEHAEAKHFGGRQMRFELGIEFATNRRDAFIAVIPLHAIIDRDPSCHIAARSEIDMQAREHVSALLTPTAAVRCCTGVRQQRCVRGMG